MYISVLLTGMFVFSAQVLVYAYVAHVYPAAARGTALGAASGIGRLGAITGPLITGVLLTAGLAYPWGFYLFAVVAAIGAVAIFLVNRDPAPDEPLPVTEERPTDRHDISPLNATGADPPSPSATPTIARGVACQSEVSPPGRNRRRRSGRPDAVPPARRSRASTTSWSRSGTTKRSEPPTGPASSSTAACECWSIPVCRTGC